MSLERRYVALVPAALIGRSTSGFTPVDNVLRLQQQRQSQDGHATFPDSFIEVCAHYQCVDICHEADSSSAGHYLM